MIKREFLIELFNFHFLKTRTNAFFYMWSLQEGGGAVYCKCLSDAILSPLSKTEFIQEALVTSSRKMLLHWMSTWLRRDGGWIPPTGKWIRGGGIVVSSIGYSKTPKLPIQDRKKSDTYIASLFYKPNANMNFPPTELKSLLPKNKDFCSKPGTCM